MKKLIILLTLVSLSFSSDKWEYCVIVWEASLSQPSQIYDVGVDSSKYNIKVKEEDLHVKKYREVLNMMGMDGN